jgi:hypothetical protein
MRIQKPKKEALGANPTYKTNPQIHQLKRSRESFKYIYLWDLKFRVESCFAFEILG